MVLYPMCLYYQTYARSAEKGLPCPANFHLCPAPQIFTIDMALSKWYFSNYYNSYSQLCLFSLFSLFRLLSLFSQFRCYSDITQCQSARYFVQVAQFWRILQHLASFTSVPSPSLGRFLSIFNFYFPDLFCKWTWKSVLAGQLVKVGVESVTGESWRCQKRWETKSIIYATLASRTLEYNTNWSATIKTFYIYATLDTVPRGV